MVARLLHEHFVGRLIHHALDIGAGPGAITAVLNQYADHLSIVEPNPAYEAILSQQFPNSTLLIDAFENITLMDCYDVILMNQCLYYIQEEKWFAICQKALSACSSKGEILIILLSY